MKILYKNISFLIVLLLFGIIYSQTSNCDSLRTIYENKLFEWYKIDVKLKTHNYTSRNQYDSLLVLYHANWKMFVDNKKEYLDCNKDSILTVKRGYPTHWERIKPTPKFSIVKIEYKDSLQLESLPRLNKDSQALMVEYIIKNYPDTLKYSGISCRVYLGFICNKEGLPDSTIVLKEQPKNMGGSELVLEAMKLVKFIPGKNKNGINNTKMLLNFDYLNGGEFNRHGKKGTKNKIILEFIPIY